MTREVAIKELRESYDMMRSYDVDERESRLMTALNMAIQALSKEPCDDTVSIRKDVLKCRVGKLVVYNVEWLKKHWQMEMDIVCGVKPCDDAISRDAVCDYIAEFVNNEYSTQAECEIVDLMIEGIQHLPSVTQKSGKWITKKDIIGVAYCSECGYELTINDTNYCPNCGAKMESEDNE